MKVFIFTKMRSKNYQKLLTTHFKHKEEYSYLNKISSYYDGNFILYDKESKFTMEDFNQIASYSKETTHQIGVFFNDSVVYDIFLNGNEIVLENPITCEHTEFEKRKEKFIISLVLSDRIIVKKEIAKIHSNNIKAKEEVLDEILDQIPICEEMGCPVTDKQIQIWLRCVNAIQVAIKAKTHKFA